MKAYIIGCGGGGSWLAPALSMLVGAKNVVLVDGDKLERKNLTRQLFTEDDIGKFKAQALAERWELPEYRNSFYGPHQIAHRRDDWLFGCVDNHPSRRHILAECDRCRCRAIIAGNERTTAEAYYYRPDWKGTPMDPRIYYPEILSTEAGDPAAAAAGCTGEAQEQTPQLVTANVMAVTLAQWLFVFWHLEYPKMGEVDDELTARLPYLMRANLTMLETLRIGDALKRKDRNANCNTGAADRAAA